MLWAVILLVILVILTLILTTIYLHYYKQAFQCDAQPSFWCFVDWLCDDGTTDALGQKVETDDMECHLKNLYGVKDSGCSGSARQNPCSPSDLPGGTNPALCTSDGDLNTDPGTDPFSCYCAIGSNIQTGYVPGGGLDQTNPDLPGAIAAGGYMCGKFANSDGNIVSICPAPPTSSS